MADELKGVHVTPKGHIEDIKSRYLTSDKEFVLPSLNRSIDRIKKAFPRYGSFLMEFIQNADDVSSTSIRIEISENEARVFNNGGQFSKEDVDSICKVGLSSKTPKGYIGYLGVGFKSVFLLSESPEIYSGDYRFKFDKNSVSNPERTPWQVIPHWVENPSIALPSIYNTAFRIPLKDPAILGNLREETKPEFLNNRMLLFLQNLRNVEIHDTINGNKKIIKKHRHYKMPEYEVYLIQEYFGGELKSQEYWLVFRRICEVPNNVKEDPMTKEWEREDVDKREVIVAFRLDENERLVKEEKGTAHVGVFSFLPLKEVPSGLNFLIQADFLTSVGRVELARICAWNDWLAKEIYKLIVERCIPVFVKDERWRTNFASVLYSQWGGHELFENNVKRPLREYLEKEACLITTDYSSVKASDAVLISTEIEELVDDSDIKVLYPNKKVLHPDSELPPEIVTIVKNGPIFNASSGVDFEMQRLIERKKEKKDIAFFKKFYQKLSGYAESTLERSIVKSQNIVPTDDWELADSGRVYIKPHDVDILPEIEKAFKIVHPDLVSDEKAAHVLKAFGAEELTNERIQDVIKRGEISKIREAWLTLPDEKKVEWIRNFKELWKKGQIDVRDLGFLTLKTNDGGWVKPEDAFFPNEYNPKHRIETLMKEKKLLDFPLQFVSEEFPIDKNKAEIEEWRVFFSELGVDKKIEQEKHSPERRGIVQRIGVLTALQFEHNEGRRDARELTPSEERGGYDIVSDSGKKIIEVKGRADPTPQIWLTPPQYKKLREEGYFLYIVRDALNYPILSVIKGEKLADVVDFNVSMDFYKWRNLSEKEFQP